MRALLCQFIAKPLFVTVHVLLIAAGLALPAALVYLGGRDVGGGLGRSAAPAEDVLRWTHLTWNTTVVTALAVVIAVSGGVLLAIPAFKTNWAGRQPLMFGCLLLAGVPIFVTSSAILGAVGFAGFEAPAIAAGAIFGVVYLPLAAVLIGLGLLCVPARTEEAAALDHPASTVISRISLPQAGWSVAAAVLAVGWLVCTDYSIPDILGVQTFAREVYNQYQLQPNQPGLYLLAIPMMCVLTLTCICLGLWARRTGGPLFQAPAAEAALWPLTAWQRPLAWAALLATTAATVAMGWALVAPLSSLRQVATIVSALGPEWAHTVQIALATAALLAAVSISTAWLLVRGLWVRWAVAAALLGLLCTPAPTLALTMTWLLNRTEPRWLMEPVLLPLYDSLWIDVCVLTLRFLPVAVLLALPAVHRVPRALEDSARLDGADWCTRMWRIYWPQGWSNAALAGVVVAVLSIGELDCVHLVSPPGIETLSKRYFSFIHTGVDAQVAVVCWVAIATVLPAIVGLFLALRRRVQHRHD